MLTFSSFRELVTPRVHLPRWGKKKEARQKLRKLWEEQDCGERFFMLEGDRLTCIIFRVKISVCCGGYELLRKDAGRRKECTAIGKAHRHEYDMPSLTAERTLQKELSFRIPRDARFAIGKYEQERVRVSKKHPGLRIRYHTLRLSVLLRRRPRETPRGYAWYPVQKKKTRNA
jgi:hypothetical protein